VLIGDNHVCTACNDNGRKVVTSSEMTFATPNSDLPDGKGKHFSLSELARLAHTIQEPANIAMPAKSQAGMTRAELDLSKAERAHSDPWHETSDVIVNLESSEGEKFLQRPVVGSTSRV